MGYKTHTKVWNLKRFYLFIFREGKGGRKRGRETSMRGCLSHTPLLGTWPTTQACALTGNHRGKLLVCRLVLNPLIRTSQGEIYFFKLYFILLSSQNAQSRHTRSLKAQSQPHHQWSLEFIPEFRFLLFISHPGCWSDLQPVFHLWSFSCLSPTPY